MATKDITQADLLAEVAAFLRQGVVTRPGDDWFTVAELMEVAQIDEPNPNTSQLRDRLDRGVEGGIFEKVSNGRNAAYYHRLQT